MQVVQAGDHKLILLELEPEMVTRVAKHAGFECKLQDDKRSMVLELAAPARQAPLLLFDAADPANLGWFSRCQFYVEGQTGSVLQTPISIANVKERSGRLVSHSIRLRIAKELPASFRLPGKHPVNEQTIYAVLHNFLTALLDVGVGICGGEVVKPLAGRIETPGTRN